MNKSKEPLYRKINKRVRKCGAYLDFGGEHRHERHTKATKASIEEGVTRSSMHAKKQRRLDYTPLYRFLLSKVGQDWDAVHSEAVSRLDNPEPIRWMVAQTEDEQDDFFNGGETSYFSGLYVDADNKLQKVKPDLCAADINAKYLGCTCCTYTLNGVPYMTQATIDAIRGVPVDTSSYSAITPRPPKFD